MNCPQLAAIEALVSLFDQMVFGYSHSVRVANLATNIALSLGWDPSRIEKIKLAALLHDIGHAKILSDRRSLERLPASNPQILDHPRIGADYISQWEPLRELYSLIANHQERIDGKGYPRGLSGDEVSSDVQLLSLCDVYIALTSRNLVRGREALDEKSANILMMRERGARWEGNLFDDFMRLRSAGGPLNG